MIVDSGENVLVGAGGVAVIDGVAVCKLGKALTGIVGGAGKVLDGEGVIAFP